MINSDIIKGEVDRIIIELMLNIQKVIDYDDSIDKLLANNHHQFMIDFLYSKKDYVY